MCRTQPILQNACNFQGHFLPLLTEGYSGQAYARIRNNGQEAKRFSGTGRLRQPCSMLVMNNTMKLLQGGQRQPV